MNTLEDKIQKDLTEAMKNHQTHTVQALRFLKRDITETRTAVGGKKDLEDCDIMKIIQKLVNQKKESMEMFSHAGRHEEADEQQQEMFALMNYLPKKLSESEMEEIVAKTIADLGATSIKDMKNVMNSINQAYPGKVDGAMLSRIVKSKLG